jgi:hypothetical protein
LGGTLPGDVRILGIARKDVRNEPDHWVVPFLLSPSPDKDWARLFEVSYNRTRSTMYRRASVAGDRIVLQAPAEEVNQYHLPRIKKAVDETNMDYRAFIQRAEETSRILEDEQGRQRADLDLVLDDIESSLNLDDEDGS